MVATIWLVFVATSLLASAFVAAAAFDLRAAVISDGEPAWCEHAAAWCEHAAVWRARTAKACRARLPVNPEPALGHTGGGGDPEGTAITERLARERDGLAVADRLRREARGLAWATVAGGVSLFVTATILIWPLDGLPSPAKSITTLACIYLVVFTIFVVVALMFSSSTTADVPWLRGGGATVGYFVVAAPVAVALALILRLTG